MVGVAQALAAIVSALLVVVESSRDDHGLLVRIGVPIMTSGLGGVCAVLVALDARLHRK